MEELEYLTKTQETLRSAKAYSVSVVTEDGEFVSFISVGELSNLEIEGFLSLNAKHANMLHDHITVEGEDE